MDSKLLGERPELSGAVLGVERLYIVDPEFSVQQQTVPMGSWLSSLRTTEDMEPLWSSLKNLPVTPYLDQQEKIQLCDHSQGHRGFLWVPPPHLYAPTKPSFWTPRFSQLCWAKRPLFTWLHELMWDPFCTRCCQREAPKASL